MKEVRVKKGFNVGSMFLGIFLGFILCLGAIAGVGFLAYNHLSVNWVNNTFKANVNLGSEELNNKTIKDFVSSVSKVASNINTYTINDLSVDFGITVGDKLMGFNISELKDVPFAQLEDEIKEKFNDLSAADIEGLIDMSSMSNILNKTNVYYYNNTNNKLYKDSALSNLVDFNYFVVDGKVVIGGEEFEISTGTISVKLKYLPLAKAVADFTSSMGDKITLGELETSYGVSLPKYFNEVDRDVTINQLSEEIDNLELANFLGYKFDALSNKYYEDKNNNGVLNAGEELTGLEKVLASTKVSGVSTRLEQLTIQDVFDDADLSSGVLSMVDKTKGVDEIPSEINKMVQEKTLGELVSNNVVTINNYNPDKEINFGGGNVKISTLTIPQIVEAIMVTP